MAERATQSREAQSQQGRSQQQTRPPATAYREVTPFLQQPTNVVPGRLPELPHDLYKTLPLRCSKKYTGDVYDLLNNKIKIFFSISEMFYIQVVERGDSFADTYIAIKNYFNHNIKNFKGEDALRTTVTNACYRILELKTALFKLATICEGLFSDLQSAVKTHLARQQTRQMLIENETAVEKQYYFNCCEEGFRAQFFSACYFTSIQTPTDFSVHLAEYKGSWREEEDFNKDDNSDLQYNINEQSPTAASSAPSTLASQFLLEDRYTRSVYQGILPDTGAANVSTVSKEQYLAFVRKDLTAKMDTSTARRASIKFGKGNTTALISTAQVFTEIRKIDFKVLNAPMLFLLCLADIDRLKFHLNKRERATVFLTETELRQLHRCFRHLAVILTLRRFKFALKDKRHFNYDILVDVMYLGNKPTLHFLRLPDIPTYDAGTSFASAEFCAEAKIIGVICKQDILFAELAGTMSDEAILQIAVKAVNDTAGPDGIVSTLLVFGAYPQMTTESPPSLLMVKRSKAIQKAMKALRKLTAEHKVAEDLLALPLQSESDPKAPRTLHTLPTPPANVAVLLAAQLRKRGCPLGPKNKRKAYVYMTKKEEADLELAIKLRNNRVITTLGAPFKASDDQEISDLIGRGVFKFKIQRVVMTLAPMLVQEHRINVELRDITQVYPQAQTNLKRTTYYRHHYEELDMSTSTYDLCLLVTNGDADAFSIVGMQTDNTLMLGTAAFASLEEKKLKKAHCTLTMQASEAILNLKQKRQGGKIKLVKIKASNCAQQYIEQRACRAYIALTCQPEASFDLSVAAQAQQLSAEDISALNKRLKWQIENLDCGLRYIPVHLNNAKLMVFVDGSFANNKDLSSQLGFVLMLVNKSTDIDNTFTIRGNIIYYSLTNMVNRFNIGIAIATTLQIITERLGLLAVPLTICTDSFSLCLVKLETTKEKRLMINIIALRRSEDNPADAFTKASPNRALKSFIDSNELTV
ncbi:hypothetical protein EK21DRAFT_103653 [Setomelanomma holmii]|uniref:Uncharacterized protein n=1 Tax=Setomelanomma holmii TaxID=210430 RepID=A0A9P4H012_9PLEO|nr:hypothetical protein EK21DRAFT_103653 [Setomelanomma holmii]